MNNTADQLAQTLSASPLTFWILGSVLAYGLATNVLWLARSRAFRPLPHGDWLVQVVRFLYYLGIPYLALGGWPRPPFSALLSPEDMGLVGLGGRWPVTRWLGSVGTALCFGLVAFLLLLLAWASANRRADSAPPDGVRLRFRPQPWWAILIDVLYLEVHWAFYRGALAAVLGDVYAGVFLGMGLVYLEWSLNPYWRVGWRTESAAAGQWLRAALALVMALIYLFTRNLWVCLGIHGVTELAFWGLGRARISVETAASRAVAGDSSPPLRSGSE